MHRAITIAKQDGIRELSYRVLMHIAQRIRGDSRRMYDIQNLIAKDSPTIVDGGAHKGETIEEFRHVYPNSKIYAFEPIPNLADELTQKYRDDSLIDVHQMALGTESTSVAFNLHEETRNSSVLESTSYLTEREDLKGSKEQISVPQSRLDDVLSEHIDLLKLDLQGYELQALQGATGLLGQTDLILTEVQFVPRYEGASQFYEIHQFLTENGFKLYNLYSHLLRAGVHLEEGDALYVRTADSE